MKFIKTCDNRIFNINIIDEILINEVCYKTNPLGYRVYFEFDNDEIDIGYFHCMEDALKVLLIGTTESANDFSITIMSDLVRNLAETMIPDYKSVTTEEWIDLFNNKKAELTKELIFQQEDWLY